MLQTLELSLNRLATGFSLSVLKRQWNHGFLIDYDAEEVHTHIWVILHV